jgi:hypothetical protein
MKTKIKNLSLIMMLALSSCASMQQSQVNPEKISDLEFEGRSKTELYTIANLWCVETFKSAQDVIQFADKDAGIISGKYIWKSMPIGYGDPKYFMATITIKIYDGKINVSIKNINPVSNSGYNLAMDAFNETVASMYDYIKNNLD